MEHRDLYGRYISHYVLGDRKVDDMTSFMCENYFSFGTVEKLDLFRQDFEKKTGITIPQVMDNVTRTKKQSILSAREISLVEKLCPEDVELYDAIDKIISRS